MKTFQSTRPVRGATEADKGHDHESKFQSTRPVRGATGKRIIIHIVNGISIHAPRAGRDSQPTLQPQSRG